MCYAHCMLECACGRSFNLPAHLGRHQRHCPPKPKEPKAPFDLPCSVDGCEQPVWVKGRGLCSLHYGRWQNHGDPEAPVQPYFRGTPEEAWERFAVRQDGHLIWTGGTLDNGRPRMFIHGRRVRVYRYAWERAHGPIPNGLVIDHNQDCPKSCVDVEHLRALTPTEHAKIGWARGEVVRDAVTGQVRAPSKGT